MARMIPFDHLGRRLQRAALFCALLLPLALLAASPCKEGKGGKSKKKGDPSAEFFASSNITHLRIEIVGTNLAQLQRDPREYVRCTVREGDKTYEDVAVHLKGAAGSFRELGDRPALTLNFDKFKDNQKFHGLDKLHLNNSVQDPSFLCELICGELFVAAEVPAARTTHARVQLNGRDVGLYVLKEGFDKTFLRRHFTNFKGNLYDSGFLRDVTEPLEKNSGEENKDDRADLKALVKAAEERDLSKRWQKLDEVLDLDRFVAFLALEVMTWHWDGYAMKRNNYRVYNNPDRNKFVFMPHGMDQMFWDVNGPLMPNWEGLIAHAVMETPAGRARYLETVSELMTNVFLVPVITNRMAEVRARIRPVLAAIHADRARDHDGAYEHLRHQIVQRKAALERMLAELQPKTAKFNSDGEAKVPTAWRAQTEVGNVSLGKADKDGRATLHIRSDGQAIASWRAPVTLPAGRYRFEAQVKTARLEPLRDGRGEGAGLRISGTQQARDNKVSGDANWTPVTYEFDVPNPEKEVTLVCESRARRGEAWFDVGSMKLVRIR